MTPTPASADPPAGAMTDEAYGNPRVSAALPAGASVLITNKAGEVLVQEVDYRSTRLLPGGGVDPAESPAAAASRELREELGVDAAVDQALAVDWVARDAAPRPRSCGFPANS